MKNIWPVILRINIVCICVLVSGCIRNDGSINWIDGTALKSDENEIKRKQEVLLNAKSPEDFPESAEGGIVFDGMVTMIDVKDSGFSITKFNIEKVLYGQLENKKQITIYSPSTQKGGVDFQMGKRYRVYTVYLKGAYHTWASTGTVKLKTKGTDLFETKGRH